jgi:hypothetical protein
MGVDFEGVRQVIVRRRKLDFQSGGLSVSSAPRR